MMPFPFLLLPNEIISTIYPRLDLETRSALRSALNGGEERLTAIEKGMKYPEKGVGIQVISSQEAMLNVGGSVIQINVDEVGKELGILRVNTHLEQVYYWGSAQGTHTTLSAIRRHLHGGEIVIFDERLGDADLCWLTQNFDFVSIRDRSAISPRAIRRLWTRLEAGLWSVKKVEVESDNVRTRWEFLERFGTFDRRTHTFSPFNHAYTAYRVHSKIVVLETSRRVTITNIFPTDTHGTIKIEIV